MNLAKYLVLMLFFLAVFLGAPRIEAKYSTSLSVQPNYRDWGWRSYVMENGLITVAVVPQIGGRAMQYDLDGHPSIYVNPDEIGRIYVPQNTSPWHNYGGYKVWPTPQKRWLVDGSEWPPPPNLDFGVYEASILSASLDSSTIHLRGPVETLSRWRTRNIRLERRLTIFEGSSRVRVEQTILNEGDSEVRWGVIGVTQCMVNHPSEEDWENFWVYFPIKKKSKFGAKGFCVLIGERDDPQWKPDIREGIAAVQHMHRNTFGVADSDGGWMAYVDERDGYLFAKRFTYFEGEVYPDSGASVEVYVSDDLPYLEVEVASPLVDLPPGGSYTFDEDWYAAKVNGPIVAVNDVGAIREKLSIEQRGSSMTLRGVYGVFYVGQVDVVLRGIDGEVIGAGGRLDVSPLETVTLSQVLSIQPGLKQVELVLRDRTGTPIGLLDALSMEAKGTPRIPE